MKKLDADQGSIAKSILHYRCLTGKETKMATRKIIKINEDLCNGCELCINACSEGALEMVNGKARLVREDFCDGFGDCLGECPTGALTIEEREASEFNFSETLEHIRKTQGQDGVETFLKAADQHGLITTPSAHHSLHGKHLGNNHGGCPGARQIQRRVSKSQNRNIGQSGLPGKVNPSDLEQWPVQLHLVNPGAPYFNNRELVVLSTCGPVASADIHWRFLRGRSVVVACPKLDRTEPYVGKLAEILSNNTIPVVLVVRMSVPCCSGLTHIVNQALSESGREDIKIREIVVDIDGTIQDNAF
jgi:NAD-dependent dihydropyrimidine dehydrogenase PreA subunit